MVGNIDLGMMREGGGGFLQESCETLLHQLHQEDGPAAGGLMDCTQELHYVGMLQTSQDDTLLLKTTGKVNCSWVIISEKDGV